MTDPLDGLRPRRPLTPPHVGAVVARGRRRRQVQLVAAGLAVTVAAALSVSVLASGPREDALLPIADDPTATAAAVDGARPDARTPVPAAPPTAGTRATSGASGATTQDAPPAAQNLSPSPRPSPRPAEPGVVRSYDGGASTVQVGGRMCSTRVGVGGTQGQTQWCGSALVSPRDDAHRVPVGVRACLDQTYAVSYPLSFAQDREADFAVVRDDGTVVWRWSRGRAAPRPAEHELTTDPGRCWTWSTTWKAVDARGRPLTGSFVLRGWVYAAEVERKLPFEQRFTL